MKTARKLLSIPAFFLLTLPAAAYAAPHMGPHAGPYVSGFIGVSVPSDSQVTTDDFNNPPAFHDQVDFDPGIYIGGSGGYDFGYLRLEGEISYRHSEINTIADLDDNNYRFRNPDGNLGVAAFMANAFFDIHNESRVTPYLGGGIGFASLHISDTYGTDTRGATNTRPQLYDEGDDTVFAYQFGAGMEIAINRRYSLDIGYRYFGTDTATFNHNSAKETSLKFESHNATVGFRVKF